MKNFFKDVDKKWKEYALAGCICVLFFVFITNLDVFGRTLAKLIKILSPVIIGFAVAFIMNLLAKFLQKKVFKSIKGEKLKWQISVLISLIIVLLLFALLLMSLIPQMASSLSAFIDNYPVYVEHLKDFVANSNIPVQNIKAVDKFLEGLSDNEAVIEKIGNLVLNNGSSIINTTTNIGGAAFNWLIGAIFAIYFLLDKRNILAAFSKFFKLVLSPLKYDKAVILQEKFDAIFSRYIACELIDSLIIGVANYIVMLILKMPNALFISFVVGITNLAPTFGPIVGAGIGAFILLLVKPVSVIPFLILTLVLQTLDAYVIKPKLFGDALNVPGVLILIAIIVFGKLFGIIGILLAIPLVAIIVYIYKEILIPWLELKKDLNKYNKELGE